MERVAKARDLRDQKGMTYGAIGQILGVSGNTVSCWLNPEYNKRQKTASKSWAIAHPKQARESQRAGAARYRAAHPDRIKAANKAYYATHVDEGKAYRLNHCKEIKTRGAEWYQAHKTEVAAHHSAYRRDHLPEYHAYAAIRRSLKAGFIAGATTAQLAEIAAIYRRAQEDPTVRCYLCGDLIPMGHRHVDHIMPVSKGGTWSPSNLAVACDECNMHKHDKLPYEVGVLI